MTNTITYLIGVDGGGTGTRVLVADAHGVELARSVGGASGLRNGSGPAWDAVLKTIDGAFAGLKQPRPELSRMAIGLGLAGVHNKQWAAEFSGKNPGFAQLHLETDSFTTLLGAHQGEAGVIIALGTGSVGESFARDGARCEVGGWGFPCGDEAGGAWLGLQAANHLQQVLDGRMPGSDFSDSLLQHCGGNRDALFTWLASASQGEYAQLAPLVVSFANQKINPDAIRIMQAGAREIAKIAQALDKSMALPVCLCGGLALCYNSYLPASLLNRLVAAHGDSAAGALLLIKKRSGATRAELK